MQPLSAHTLVAAWEEGRNRHPIDRALMLRALSKPGADPATLADEPLGQCNAALLEAHSTTFGPLLRAHLWRQAAPCTAPVAGEQS